jgi:hypothetical protein
LQVFASTVGERSARLAYERSLSLLLWNDVLGLLKVSHRDELTASEEDLASKAKDSDECPDTKSNRPFCFVATTYHNELQLVLNATNRG